MRKLLLATALITLGLPLRAAEPCVTLDPKGVAALFDDWNFALSSLEPSQVVQRYWPNAVLLPTVSNTPRTSPAMITDYFEHFLAKRPRGRIDTRTVQSGCNMAMDMGTYTFSLMNDKGITTEVAARYTFVYQYHDGAWKILHHHSSAMPETGSAPVAHHEAEKNSTAAHAEPAPKPERKERKPKRAAVSKPPAAAVAAVAPASKHEESRHEEAKPAADAKADHDAKAAPDAKAAHDTKATPDAKPAPDAKAAPELNAATDTKVTPESKTAMFVNLTTSPSPSKFYPPESARRKERGSVNLKVCADGEGAVTETMEVLKSSGSKLLDEAAMSWARAATWVPATLNRRRVEGCTKVDVAFEAQPLAAQART